MRRLRWLLLAAAAAFVAWLGWSRWRAAQRPESPGWISAPPGPQPEVSSEPRTPRIPVVETPAESVAAGPRQTTTTNAKKATKATKKATKKVAKKTTTKATKKATEKTAKKTAKRAVKEAAKEPVEKPVDRTEPTD